MSVPMIPRTTYIRTEAIPRDEHFADMRIVRCQTNAEMLGYYEEHRFEFLTDLAKRHVIPGVVLARKGDREHYRITAMTHPTLRQFIEIVRYDPSNPPLENYEAMGMNSAHTQTQQDFRGAKKENLAHFKQYLLESFRGERTAYLPTVSGWQAAEAFEEAIFVAFDEHNENALYGTLYLPKKPVMQSDGQTQTAALFQAAATGLAMKSEALDTFCVTLEIELNVTQDQAGQSFADRNGRGSKKNKNLVAQLDGSSPLAQLRRDTLRGTIFENRLADGRNTGTSETATDNIVDLSTMEQMLLAVTTRGTKKAEQIKHYHVARFEPYCREFLALLEETFRDQWPKKTPHDREPFRRTYIHGWAFVLKAFALAYHDARRDVLGPLASAVSQNLKDEHTTSAEAEKAYLAAVKEIVPEQPRIDYDEFCRRLREIDWHRYRQHWIDITGFKVDKDGKKKTRIVKDPEAPEGRKEVVEGKAENTAASINSVANKIMSDSWRDLCSDVDAKL